MTGEPAMRDREVSLGGRELVLGFQRARQRADQVEQAVAAGRDVRAVLDVAVRPIAFGVVVVALVEERVEGLENKRLVLLRAGLLS
jgi:hypothetical protein